MSEEKDIIRCSGYCNNCRTEHLLPPGNAKNKALELFEKLKKNETLALFSTDTGPTRQLSTKPLFGEERGKMFGVLECLDKNHNTTWIYAFSGQFNTRWLIDGWAPPLFDIATYNTINDPAEKIIKELGRQIESAADTSEFKKKLRHKRKNLSQELMRRIHTLYRVTNFHGTTVSLDEAFLHPGGKPTGTGDCCAPKLLNLAARNNLLPISIAEFFFGRDNRAGTKKHGCFYPSCSDKCRPLLGYMLCGIEQRKNSFGI